MIRKLLLIPAVWIIILMVFVACREDEPKQSHTMQYRRGDKVILKTEVPAVILGVYPHENKYKIRVFTHRYGSLSEVIYAFEIEGKAK